MINHQSNNNFESNYKENINSMKIAANSNIFSILSNKIYERPIEAVIREVFSNAIDANVEAGKTSGLKMHLPTDEEQYFSVSDSGAGMDIDKLLKVFFTYGISTKNDDNNQIGGFGIGTKSPFAYTDQFTIESKKNGKKVVFVALKDENDCPCHSDPFVEDCDINETGTTISFGVSSDDIGDFYKAAVKVLMFSKEFPDLNAEAIPMFEKYFYMASSTGSTLEDFKAFREANKTSHCVKGLSDYNGFFIEMGGVLYSVNSYDVSSSTFLSLIENVCKIFKDNGAFLVHIPIGQLSVQASREKLNFTKETVKTLMRAIQSSVASLIKEASEVISNSALSLKERYAVLSNLNMDALERAAVTSIFCGSRT